MRLARHAFALDVELEEQRVVVLLGELPDHFAAARALEAADFTRRLPLVRRHCPQHRVVVQRASTLSDMTRDNAIGD